MDTLAQAKAALEEKYRNLNSHVADFGDKTGVNKILSTPALKKARMALIAAKGGIHTAGTEKIDDLLSGFGGGEHAADMLSSASGAAFGLSAPFKGKEIAKQQEQAALRRRMQAQGGYKNSYGDGKASIGNSAANLKSLANSTAMLNMATGHGGMGLVTPGTMLSKMGGGIENVGGGIADAAGGMIGDNMLGNAIGGMNPLMMGMMAAVAATKGAKGLYNMSQKDSSTNITRSRSETITRGTSPHQLENEYGSTTSLRTQIARLQRQHGMSAGEAMIAGILAMIEGHTSVLPILATTKIDEESRKNKEGGNTAQNILDGLFGNDGSSGNDDQRLKKKAGIVSRILTGMEKGTANLSSTFDIMGQISNTLSGNSSTALFNEANSKEKIHQVLKAEKKFGDTFGISTGMVQAIHTTPAQIMAKAETYEAKVLSVLGLNSEINRFSAHELLRIRTDGFGIGANSSSSNLLSTLKMTYEMQEAADEKGPLAAAAKGLDELLGYIPGWQMLSGTAKMTSDMMQGIGQFSKDYLDGKVRSPMEVFTEWMQGDSENTLLNSETALRAAVGATEASPEAMMAGYLGMAFPDRFELLLKYNLSQMESLESMAGNIKRSSLEALTMNKYTARQGDLAYHERVNADISDRLDTEMASLNDSTGFFSQMWMASEENQEAARRAQVLKAMNGDPNDDKDKGNQFLREFMENNGGINSEYNSGRGTEQLLSAQDSQNAQAEEEWEERKMSASEQQVALLQEIRDCVCCDGKRGKGRRKGKGKGGNGEGDGDGDGSGFGGLPGYLSIGGKNKIVPTHGPMQGPKPPPSTMSKMWKSITGFITSPLKSLKSWGAKGMGIMLGKLAAMLGPWLLNPWVAGALGVVAAGVAAYGAYEWVTGMFKDKKESMDLDDASTSQKAQADVNVKEAEAMAKMMGKDIDKTAEIFAEKYSIEELRFMKQHDDATDFMIAAINKAIILKGGKLHRVERDQILADHWGIGENLDGFSKDGKFLMSQMGKKELASFFVEEGANIEVKNYALELMKKNGFKFNESDVSEGKLTNEEKEVIKLRGREVERIAQAGGDKFKKLVNKLQNEPIALLRAMKEEAPEGGFVRAAIDHIIMERDLKIKNLSNNDLKLVNGKATETSHRKLAHLDKYTLDSLLAKSSGTIYQEIYLDEYKRRQIKDGSVINAKDTEQSRYIASQAKFQKDLADMHRDGLDKQEITKLTKELTELSKIGTQAQINGTQAQINALVDLSNTLKASGDKTIVITGQSKNFRKLFANEKVDQSK